MTSCSKCFVVIMIVDLCYYLTPISLYRHSLREVLDASNVMNMIKDTKAAQEVQSGLHFLVVSSTLIVHTGDGMVLGTIVFSGILCLQLVLCICL